LTGGVEGAGAASGSGLILSLTRLGTTHVKYAASKTPPGRVTLANATEQFLAAGRSGSEARDIVESYLDWLRARNITFEGLSLKEHVAVYCGESNRRNAFEEQLLKTAHLAKKPGQLGW